MRTGYTTGTCAAAAAKAAVLGLVGKSGKNPVHSVKVHLPVGKVAELAIERLDFKEKSVVAEVRKDGGDDPDVTHGALICAEVSWNEASSAMEIHSSTGVGIVTKPGLPVPVGEPAINPIPRKMILHEVKEVLDANGISQGVKITIFVPDGEKIAEQTMNAKLGIIGGISILGTRGLVIPFSTAAYRSTLAVTIKASAENGQNHLVLTTGGRSEKYAKGLYPQLDSMAFHEAGEFIGFAIKKCLTNHIQKVTVAGMMGKLSKVAAGELMLHSSKSSVDFSFLAALAEKAGADEKTVQEVQSANTASQVGELMQNVNCLSFFDLLTENCCEVCSRKAEGQLAVEVLLFSMDGKLLNKKSLAAKNPGEAIKK